MLPARSSTGVTARPPWEASSAWTSAPTGRPAVRSPSPTAAVWAGATRYPWATTTPIGSSCPWGPTTKYYIREAGLDNPAGSGGPDKWSSYQITGEDGHDAFLASNPAYRNYIRRGVNRCITGVYSRHYQAGATLAGIGVFTETTYNTTTSQCIQAGYKRTRRHWEWGRGGQFTDRLARTLYSY